MGLARKQPIWQLGKPWLSVETDCMVCTGVWAGKEWGLTVQQGLGSTTGGALRSGVPVVL